MLFAGINTMSYSFCSGLLFGPLCKLAEKSVCPRLTGNLPFDAAGQNALVSANNSRTS